jgi:hypothetical protein
MLNRLFGTTVRRVASCLLAMLLPVPAALAAAGGWKPITEAERTIESSGLDTSAGAIVLLREISVDDSDAGGTEVDYYIRVKVLSAKGVEALNKTEIPFDRDHSIRNLAARVIKADGTIVEVEKKAFFTREVVKVGKEAVSVKAFSFPGLEPGCIAEYRYRIMSDDALGGMRLNLDDDYPVARARIRIRPFSYPGLSIKMIWSQDAHIENKGKDKHDYYVFEGTNIPVVPEEPLMPPDEVTHPWFAFYFTLQEPEMFWNYLAGELVEGGKVLLKPNAKITKAAETITAGATTSEEKIARLYEHCRTQIKNLSHDACGYTPDEIADLKPASKPIDVLTLGYGTGGQINLLFAAMLRALKAECSLVYCGDRSQGFFNRTIAMRSTLPDLIVGLKYGDTWRFYDPGALYVPLGNVQWRNEGTTAMVIEGKYFNFIETPRSPADYSTIQRQARLRLDAEGTIEGDIEITYTGHAGTATKHLHDTKTTEESLELIRDELVKRLGRADVTAFEVLHARDPEKPVTMKFHIRVEGYAESTEGRMFVQPAFFQKGVEARLPAKNRQFDIYFPYSTTEEDTVVLELPEGFEHEATTAPKSLNQVKEFTYLPRLRYAEDFRSVTYQRTLTLDILLILKRAYPWLKTSFDHMHRQDGFAITLKRVAAPTAPVAPEPSVEPAATTSSL